MKNRLLVLLGIAAVLALFTVPASVTQAASGVLCTVDPKVGPIGTVFHISCGGFSPNTYLTTYYVEPDGAAVTAGSVRTNEMGRADTSFRTFVVFYAVPYGTYTMVVDELGLAKSIIYHGEISFRVTGGTEGVSGAKIWTDKTKAPKNEFVNFLGSGFEPYESVSLWYEYPNGDCGSLTGHGDLFNFPAANGASTMESGHIKADATGAISFGQFFRASECEGTYHIVARGDTSHRGAETTVEVTGNEIKTSAWLTPSASKVMALFGTMRFTGGGFGADEPVTCWVTTPQGRATSILPDVKADGSGRVSFSIYTGSYVASAIAASEGALGEYSVTCRGDVTHRDAIAQFQVTGGMLDP